MPFATLPGSEGFVAPQAPSWAPFAAQAVDLIGRQQPVNTAELVQNAVGQINKILEMSSPEAKLKRELQMTQLQFMQEVFRDYKSNPEKYKMTANGPVLKDPLQMAERVMRYKQAESGVALNTEKLRQSRSSGNVSGFINGIVADSRTRFGSKDYDGYTVNPPDQSTVIGTPEAPEAKTPDLEPSTIPNLLLPNPAPEELNLDDLYGR